LNNEALSKAIEAAERELAMVSGAISQLHLTYPVGSPAPSLKWVQETLKSFGVEFVDLLVFPHRNGAEFKGLLVSTRPNRELPEDWLLTTPPAIGESTIQYFHRGLNAEYYKLAS
jgi:hypothetical protein